VPFIGDIHKTQSFVDTEQEIGRVRGVKRWEILVVVDHLVVKCQHELYVSAEFLAYCKLIKRNEI